MPQWQRYWPNGAAPLGRLLCSVLSGFDGFSKIFVRVLESPLFASYGPRYGIKSGVLHGLRRTLGRHLCPSTTYMASSSVLGCSTCITCRASRTACPRRTMTRSLQQANRLCRSPAECGPLSGRNRAKKSTSAVRFVMGAEHSQFISLPKLSRHDGRDQNGT